MTLRIKTNRPCCFPEDMGSEQKEKGVLDSPGSVKYHIESDHQDFIVFIRALDDVSHFGRRNSFMIWIFLVRNVHPFPYCLWQHVEKV